MNLNLRHFCFCLHKHACTHTERLYSSTYLFIYVSSDPPHKKSWFRSDGHPYFEYFISQTEALGWDDTSSKLEIIPSKNPRHETLAGSGKIMALKYLNPQMVWATRSKAWIFVIRIL
jgi:hypothetical protein